MTRVILYALIVGAIVCPTAWGRAASVKWVAVKTDGLECRQCAIYAKCMRVLKGSHKAEAKRIWEAHRVVCPIFKSRGKVMQCKVMQYK